MRAAILGSFMLLATAGLVVAQPEVVPSSTAKPPPQPPLPALDESPGPIPRGIAKPSRSRQATNEEQEPGDRGPEVIPLKEPVGAKEEDLGLPVRYWRGDNGEYLLWWMKNSRLPPLVTTNTLGGSPSLAVPGTRPLFGDGQTDSADHSGGRFTLGEALGKNDPHLGLEGTYLFLGTRSAVFSDGGNGTPGSVILGRPYIDAATGLEQAHLLAAPSVLAGDVVVTASSRLQGVEMNGAGILWEQPRFQLDLLAGFRYFELDEGINIIEQMSDPNATLVSRADQFDGHNRFYGGQLGLRADLRRGCCFVNLLGKVAMGESYEVVRINGLTQVTPLDGPLPLKSGGLLALATNSGRYHHETFAVLPEFGVKAGVQLSEQARFFVGYSFLYLSDVARPGDQIDRTLNVGLLPLNQGTGPVSGPARPVAPLQQTDFWAQGLTIGFEFRY